MRKRIQFYTDNPVQGGGNKYFVDLIKSVQDDYEVHIATNKNGFFEGDRKQLSNVAVCSVPVFKWASGKFQSNLWLAKVTTLVLPVFFILNVFSFVFLVLTILTTAQFQMTGKDEQLNKSCLSCKNRIFRKKRKSNSRYVPNRPNARGGRLFLRQTTALILRDYSRSLALLFASLTSVKSLFASSFEIASTSFRIWSNSS